MRRYKVYRCRCSEECRTGRNVAWIAEHHLGHATSWPTWQRAMLRATRGW